MVDIAGCPKEIPLPPRGPRSPITAPLWYGPIFFSSSFSLFLFFFFYFLSSLLSLIHLPSLFFYKTPKLQTPQDFNPESHGLKPDFHLVDVGELKG